MKIKVRWAKKTKKNKVKGNKKNDE